MPEQTGSPKALRTATAILRTLRQHADRERAVQALRFFKSGPREYGEGDRFLGLAVPTVRALIGRCAELDPGQLEALLESPWHEARLLALLLMVRDHDRGDAARGRTLFELYLRRSDRINNWDLVDSSAEYIVGPHIGRRPSALLTRLSRSRSLWERRIAIIATFHDIKRGDAREALRMARALLDDPHDLIHKAVGWMLREVGKRCSRDELLAFLDAHAARMPRTALRYAIEHLPASQRQHYLAATRAR
jgi:3-methyladenine DNA glycosylase AlkD